MKEIFTQIGVDVTPENRKEIDKRIHEMLGVTYKDCPTTWKVIKKRLEENEDGFITDLDHVLGSL